MSARLSSRRVPLLYLPERIQPCFHHPHRTPPARTSLRTQSNCTEEGEFHARYDKFRVTVIVPKAFYNQSIEAKEAAEELSKKIKAEEDAKEMAKNSAASKRATVAPTKKKTHQMKPAKDTKTTEQTTAPAPAKEDAPVSPCQ